MPIRQTADAAAQSTVSGAITAAQTTITLVSATGFPAILTGGQQSVTILDSGNPSWNASTPLATPYEYQQVNAIAGNVLTFGPGGGAAARSSFAGTTPKAFFAGATVAATLLAEDIVASAPWKYDEQTPSGVTAVTIPASGTIPASYLGIPFRHIKIVFEGRSSAAAFGVDLAIQFNGDNTANYNFNQLYGAAGAAASSTITATASAGVARVPAASATAVLSGFAVIHIPSYSRTTYQKMALCQGVSYEGGSTSFFTLERNAQWNSTAAITSILLFLTNGSFVSGSLVTTYLIP